MRELGVWVWVRFRVRIRVRVRVRSVACFDRAQQCVEQDTLEVAGTACLRVIVRVIVCACVGERESVCVCVCACARKVS